MSLIDDIIDSAEFAAEEFSVSPFTLEGKDVMIEYLANWIERQERMLNDLGIDAMFIPLKDPSPPKEALPN